MEYIEFIIINAKRHLFFIILFAACNVDDVENIYRSDFYIINIYKI